MEAKEIIDIIVGILERLGLLACAVGASYCVYSIVMIDKPLKRALKRYEDELAKMEKEE